MFKLSITNNFNPLRAFRKFRKDRNIGEIEKLAGGEILVGFPESAKSEDGLSIAKYAKYNNYGTFTKDENGKPTGHIQARPFFTKGFYFDKYQERRGRLAKRLLKQIAQRKKDAQEAAELIGTQAVSDVRDSISTGPWAPNAPSTMARKLKKSKGKKAAMIKPLIDTGDMIGAVTYIVKVAK